MKPPPVTKAQILKGLRAAHSRIVEAEAAVKAARSFAATRAPNTPEWEAAAAKAYDASERVIAELWRLVGAVQFYIGVHR